MSSHHAEAHEALLERALAGDLDAGDPALAQLLQECGECRGEYEAMQTLSARLRRSAAERDAILAQTSTRTASAAEEARVRASLGTAGTRTEGQAFARRWWPLTAAALLLLSIGAWRVFAPPDPKPPPVPLGERIPCIAPLGAAGNDIEFSWSYQRPPGGYFRLRVWDAASGPAAPPIFETSDPIESTTWRPPDEILHAWPLAIRWQVEAFDVANTSIARSELHAASRSGQ